MKIKQFDVPSVRGAIPKLRETMGQIAQDAFSRLIQQQQSMQMNLHARASE